MVRALFQIHSNQTNQDDMAFCFVADTTLQPARGELSLADTPNRDPSTP